MVKFYISLLLILAALTTLQAQKAPPYWDEIVAFKKLDSAQAPIAHCILFTGSSSFRKWTDVNTCFPGYPIVNRAFGGSTLKDVIRYIYEAISPYQPKQVVIYCGENDLASADSTSVAEVILRVKTLYGILRTNLPDARISYVSIKPSPSRMKIQVSVKEANKRIKDFIKKQKNADFIDLYDAMLDAKGNMREELYLTDRLHMKPEGYVIWQKIILPYLVK